MRANPNIRNPNILAGPAFCECSTGWSNHGIINDMGYLDRFGSALNALVVMHYPTHNCPALDGTRPPMDQQYPDIIRRFGLFAQHHGQMSATHFASLYNEMTAIARRSNMPLILLETNTASCNGFLGLSDSFLAALWNLDLGMQLASTGFTHAMIHLGGQQAYYNVSQRSRDFGAGLTSASKSFMAPPWNGSEPFMWVSLTWLNAVRAVLLTIIRRSRHQCTLSLL